MSETTPLARRILAETTKYATVQAISAILAGAVNIPLSRLLERRDYGVYGICTFYIGLGSLFGDGGLGATLLRRKGDVAPEEYRATLTTLLVASTVLGITLFLAAPWIGLHNHFSLAETNVLRAMSSLYLVNALRVVPYVRLERGLHFARIARIELASSVVRHSLAISVALFKGGVWALVVSNLVGAVLQLTLAYRASPGWVGIGWSWRVFKPLIAFGGKVQALGFCAYLKDNISNALLGIAFGPAAVGAFEFGKKYIEVPVTAVNSLARVQLPVYARLTNEDPELHAAFRGALRFALLLGIPFLGAAALASPWIIPVLVGPKWLASTPVIWGLLANMVGGLIASPLFTLLQGQGRPGLALNIFIGWTLSTWALAIGCVHFFPGALGPVALAYSIITVIVVAGLLAWARGHLRRGLFRSLLPPIASGVLGLTAGFALRTYGIGWTAHPLCAAAASVGVYFALLFTIEGQRVLNEIRTVISSLRPKKSPPASEQPANAH